DRGRSRNSAACRRRGAVPWRVPGTVPARAGDRRLGGRPRLVPGLYWRHRARDLRRGAPITPRGFCHAPCSSRRSPVRAAAPDGQRSALRVDHRGAPRHRMRMWRNGRAAAVATLAYTVLALAYTWPLPIRLATGVTHDLGDPLLNTWILWWSGTHVPLTAQWWNAPAFY